MSNLKHLFLPLFIFSILLWGCESSPLENNQSNIPTEFVATDTTFEVITWNIQSFPKAGDSTIAAVLRVIRKLDIDVAAFQEITDSLAFRRLVDSLPGWHGYVATTSAYNINLAYLFKENSYQTGVVQEILNKSEYRRPFPRYPLKLSLSWYGIKIEIINNHYKASGDGILTSDPYDEERRRYDASLLLDEYIRTFLPNDNVIILGDLNDEVTDPEAHNVFMPFLSRQGEYLFCDINIAKSNPNNWSYPTFPSHIDHIIITNELFDEFRKKGSMITVIKAEEYFTGGWNEYSRKLSDHRPVALKLVF